jgi:hypothetical protein
MKIDADTMMREIEREERLRTKLKERLEAIFKAPIDIVILKDHETWEEVNRREKWKRIAREETERARQSVESVREKARTASNRKADTSDGYRQSRLRRVV